MENSDQLKEPHPRARVLILVSLLFVALLIRLIDLNAGMWIDEILTYTHYARMPYLEIVKTFDSENQHFLYSILAHTSFLIFGESVWALRLPAVIFGTASIGALYLLGRLVTNELEAILSAALLTFSYYHVWFSQNGRGYTGLLFWALLSSWLFLKAYQDKKPWLWILYALTAVLGIYTHITMIFMVVGQLIIFLIQILYHWGRWKVFQNSFPFWQSSVFLLIGLFILIFFSSLGSHFINTLLSSEQLVKQAWIIPFRIAGELIEAFDNNLISLLVLLLFVPTSLIGIIRYTRTNPVVTGLFLFPILTGLATAIILNHFIWPRYFFYLIGFAALFIIRGVVAIAGWLTKLPILSNIGPWRLTICFCICLILLSAISVPRAYGPKQDFGEALTYIETNRRPGDVVAAVGFTIIPYTDYYKTNWKKITSVAELNALRLANRRVWLVYTLTDILSTQATAGLMTKISHDCSSVKQFPGTLEGGEIMICLQ